METLFGKSEGPRKPAGSSSHAYYVWRDERSPVVIELRIDVVDRLLADVEAACASGVEAGGLLLGYSPTSSVPTLRVEDYEIFQRRAEDGPYYNLTSEERTRFAAERARHAGKDLLGLGLFRTDIRAGALEASASDRATLDQEFQLLIHVLLVIRAAAPRQAAFFVRGAGAGDLSGPALVEFPFESAVLMRLAAEWKGPPGRTRRTKVRPKRSDASQQEADESAQDAAERLQRSLEAKPFELWPKEGVENVAVGVLLFAFLAALTLTAGAPLLNRLLPGSQNVDLNATSDGRVVQLHWNNSMWQLQNAASGSITIADGANQRTVRMDPDELKTGSLAYQRQTGHVDFTLQVNLPDSLKLVQSATWTAPGTP